MYKRSYNATNKATLDVVIRNKITARYDEKSADAIEDAEYFYGSPYL